MFDYQCTMCDSIEERVVHDNNIDMQMCECHEEMRRLPAGPQTTFRFNDTKVRKLTKQQTQNMGL